MFETLVSARVPATSAVARSTELVVEPVPTNLDEVNVLETSASAMALASKVRIEPLKSATSTLIRSTPLLSTLRASTPAFCTANLEVELVATLTVKLGSVAVLASMNEISLASVAEMVLPLL